ncbi:MAG: hypothetical protein Q8Q85_05265 [Gemmatimonadales bacterium]|nr:hypothetical protein [Gemmatimonadales bacterium]
MTRLDQDDVWSLYASSLKRAKEKLAELSVFSGKEPHFSGLSGWVFEQTVQHCIRKELKAKRVRAEVTEQVSLGGRAKADLVVGTVAIEIKTSGLFSLKDATKYKRYRKAAEARGLRYVYLTWEESFLPYKRALDRALGKKNVFYLNDDGEWQRFIAFLAGSSSVRAGSQRAE